MKTTGYIKALIALLIFGLPSVSRADSCSPAGYGSGSGGFGGYNSGYHAPGGDGAQGTDNCIMIPGVLVQTYGLIGPWQNGPLSRVVTFTPAFSTAIGWKDEYAAIDLGTMTLAADMSPYWERWDDTPHYFSDLNSVAVYIDLPAVDHGQAWLPVAMEAKYQVSDDGLRMGGNGPGLNNSMGTFRVVDFGYNATGLYSLIVDPFFLAPGQSIEITGYVSGFTILSPVPEPGGIVLLGSFLVGAGAFLRRRRAR